MRVKARLEKLEAKILIKEKPVLAVTGCEEKIYFVDGVEYASLEEIEAAFPGRDCVLFILGMADEVLRQV